MRSRRLLLGVTGFLAVLALGLIAQGSSPTPTSVPESSSNRDQRERQTEETKREQRRPLRARSPNTIAFWDESRGLVGTGHQYERGSAGRILLTDDGGRTFRVVLRTKVAVTWVDTAGEGDAWAIAVTRPGTKQTWHSGDGGQSWQRLPTSGAWGLSFGSPTEGLAVAGASVFQPASEPVRRTLLSSSDGGLTWHPLSDPCPRLWYATVSFPTTSQALVVCQPEGAVGMTEKSVYSSLDGGQTWERVAYTDERHRVGGLDFVGYPSGLTISPQGFGFMWGTDFDYVTRDGGRHWSRARGLPRLSYVLSAAMVSSKSGFVLHHDGAYRTNPYKLFGTHDGGKTWTLVHRWVAKARKLAGGATAG